MECGGLVVRDQEAGDSGMNAPNFTCVGSLDIELGLGDRGSGKFTDLSSRARRYTVFGYGGRSGLIVSNEQEWMSQKQGMDGIGSGNCVSFSLSNQP